ncbi:hypothetical protein NECAME_03901 [Necator americanus]|uniref:Uncharacterized protein n=1 Tax=Necator americanus TaxID=51031 RepID=W2SZR2_NECAM|nr:hypothetical protein NECAME_03901 [Necator americanus]ETN74769.1 hypothetical protein NECAME_03901 [Necator americanus]
MYSQQGDGSSQNEFACSGRPLSEMFHDMSDSEESEEDSDAEFLVHPILRSLIKSKSAYTVSRNPPRLKASKTVFEINISKMWESTADEEAPVANFTPDLDSKWPEPDSPSPRLTQVWRRSAGRPQNALAVTAKRRKARPKCRKERGHAAKLTSETESLVHSPALIQ